MTQETNPALKIIKTESNPILLYGVNLIPNLLSDDFLQDEILQRVYLGSNGRIYLTNGEFVIARKPKKSPDNKHYIAHNGKHYYIDQFINAMHEVLGGAGFGLV